MQPDWKDFLSQADAIVRSYRAQAPEGFDPQNTFAAIAVGAVVVGAGAYSASQASAANKNAQTANMNQAAATNAYNLMMNQQNRGSTGFTTMPLYATTAGGSPFEPQLFGDTRSVYDATGTLSPQSQLDQYGNIIGITAGAQAGAGATVNDIYNGGLLQQDLSNLAPVQASRLTAVATQKQGTLEALQGTLNNIKAIQAGKGYGGDSFGSNLLSFAARQGANTTASNALSAAQEANAADTNRIQANDINRRLANLSVPYQMAQQNINTANLPNNTLLNQMALRQQLFGQNSGFRIPLNNYQIGPAPQATPVAGNGQIIGQAVGSLGQMALGGSFGSLTGAGGSNAAGGFNGGSLTDAQINNGSNANETFMPG